ncbi:hypothetical protein Zmor_013425 [Zophobas morio]|uniref:Uncharacterized protein n=1 Tax=Zophobas morio TaxID=2755281 RepID=A0AA38IIH2_9CUCU|nr:hypothetical protein Zmor_013425 [Zophobas morio]
MFLTLFLFCLVRSRRASQDGGRVAKENLPWMRSKSRSVDHGISSPFDLEALRAKVDSQLDKNLDRGESVFSPHDSSTISCSTFIALVDRDNSHF